MSNACTPILVGIVSPVLEILLLSKTAKFPFLTMDYSPWSSKNLIDWNRLKKFMQVGVDVKCMHTNFGGHSLSSFGDIATFTNGQISLSDHGSEKQIFDCFTSKNCNFFFFQIIFPDFLMPNFDFVLVFYFKFFYV